MSICTDTQPQTQPVESPADSPRVTHLFCPWCYPAPQLGDTVTALCGFDSHFLGTVAPNGRECRTCLVMEPGVLAFRGCPNCPD